MRVFSSVLITIVIAPYNCDKLNCFILIPVVIINISHKPIYYLCDSCIHIIYIKLLNLSTPFVIYLKFNLI